MEERAVEEREGGGREGARDGWCGLYVMWPEPSMSICRRRPMTKSAQKGFRRTFGRNQKESHLTEEVDDAHVALFERLADLVGDGLGALFRFELEATEEVGLRSRKSAGDRGRSWEITGERPPRRLTCPFGSAAVRRGSAFVGLPARGSSDGFVTIDFASSFCISAYLYACARHGTTISTVAGGAGGGRGRHGVAGGAVEGGFCICARDRTGGVGVEGTEDVAHLRGERGARGRLRAAQGG